MNKDTPLLITRLHLALRVVVVSLQRCLRCATAGCLEFHFLFGKNECENHRYKKAQPSKADKFIWNEFEQLSETKLPRRGEVHGRTS